ncbi:MAG: V-type ATPase 116kDa subunit family protein [bacterium]|nr:V-type ATPase 116kDa subunit family protein [bacterium]
MAIVEMKKIRAYVHKSAAGAVFETCQRLGIVEFSDISPELKLNREEKTDFEFNRAASRLQFAVEFLSKFESKKKSLKTMIEGDKICVKQEKMEHLFLNFNFNTVVEELVSLEEDINKAKTSLRDVKDKIIIASEWTFLKNPLSDLLTGKTKTFLLKGDEVDMVTLVSALSENDIVYHSYSHGALHILTVFNRFSEKTASLSSSFHLEIISLPHISQSAEEYLHDLHKREAELKDEVSLLDGKVRSFLPKISEIKILADYLRWKKEKHDILSSSSKVQEVLVFEGWIPTKKITALKQAISKETLFFEMEEAPLAEGEEPPVEIENKGPIKAFESVTRLYGLPGYRDLDPTLFLSVFFFVFFGLSLTDFGYGMLLALILGFILLKYEVPKDSKPLMTLLFWGGLSAAIFGLLFGGYLGINPEVMPNWVQALQKFDPIGSPMPVLLLSLGLGVLQVMFGLVLKIVREAKNGALLEGLLDQGPWLLTFVSLLLYGANSFGLISGNSSLYVMATLISVGLIVASQARKGETLIGKFFKGLMSLYDSVGYFSDVLSYSRILALGLATSALAFAVNLIAVLLRDMIPVVGPVVMVLVLIVGHIFNIAVNLLGAFIHSARLQFVEFFSKFIVGSGKPFKPFRREERYVVVEE